MINDFIPAGYEQPKTAGGFTKLEAGENKFRILSSPLLMWLEWRDGKPTRHRYDANQPAPAKGPDKKDSVKHAWALVVWNYKTSKIEVFECDKAGIIASILELSNKPAWGHPKNYDITIKKSGSGMETEYLTQPEPPTPPSQEIIDAFVENPVNLAALFEGNSPFGTAPVAANPSNPNAQPAASSAKVVTPENWVTGDPAPAGFEIDAATNSLKKKALPF